MMLFVFTLIGTLGMICHWAKKVGRGESKSSLIEYILSNKWHTLAAFSTMFAGVLTLIDTDAALSQQTFAMAWMAGFGADSLANKDADKE